MSGEERDSAEYLRQARERIKRRSGAWMSLVVGPFILLGTALKVFEPHDYPAGDLRNDPLFWAVLAAFAVLLVGTMMIGSVRALLRGDG